MKVCFPVLSLEGPASQVFGHFGSAPGFVVVMHTCGGHGHGCSR